MTGYSRSGKSPSKTALTCPRGVATRRRRSPPLRDAAAIHAIHYQHVVEGAVRYRSQLAEAQNLRHVFCHTLVVLLAARLCPTFGDRTSLFARMGHAHVSSGDHAL